MEREVISIYEFCDLIPQWKKKGGEMISEFLKERSQKLVQTVNNKIKNQRAASACGVLTRQLSVNSLNQTKKVQLNQTTK
jgi:hypothetical protein